MSPDDADAPAITDLTNAIIACIRAQDPDPPNEIVFWALCNVLVSLMAIEPKNRDFMRAVLNKSPWDDFARKRREQNDLMRTRPRGQA